MGHVSAGIPVSWVPLILLVLQSATLSASNCLISEFSCKSSALCIRLDQVCDGRDNCGDRSDEPEGCTRE